MDPELLNHEEDMDDYDFCIPQLTAATEQVEEFAKKVWAAGWNCCHFKVNTAEPVIRKNNMSPEEYVYSLVSTL